MQILSQLGIAYNRLSARTVGISQRHMGHNWFGPLHFGIARQSTPHTVCRWDQTRIGSSRWDNQCILFGRCRYCIVRRDIARIQDSTNISRLHTLYMLFEYHSVPPHSYRFYSSFSHIGLDTVPKHSAHMYRRYGYILGHTCKSIGHS